MAPALCRGDLTVTFRPRNKLLRVLTCNVCSANPEQTFVFAAKQPAVSDNIST